MEGLISGLAHPIIGLDDLLFLVAIGCLTKFSRSRYLFYLLILTSLGSFLSIYIPYSISYTPTFIGISLIAIALVLNGLLNQNYILPMIILHGYALGEASIGNEPTPIITYLIGLVISEFFLIVMGGVFIKHFYRYKNIFSGILIIYGAIFTFNSIVSLI